MYKEKFYTLWNYQRFILKHFCVFVYALVYFSGCSAPVMLFLMLSMCQSFSLSFCDVNKLLEILLM